MVMEACEHMLYCAGSLLTQDQRILIETSISRGLACLCRGIFSLKCDISDRKICRGSIRDSAGSHKSIEKLRLDKELQIGLIRLALADITAPSASGTLSGNLSVFKYVLELLCSNADKSIRMECKRIYSIVNAIMFPSAVPIPSVGVTSVIRGYLEEHVALDDLNSSNKKQSGLDANDEIHIDMGKTDREYDSYSGNMNSSKNSVASVGSEYWQSKPASAIEHSETTTQEVDYSMFNSNSLRGGRLEPPSSFKKVSSILPQDSSHRSSESQKIGNSDMPNNGETYRSGQKRGFQQINSNTQSDNDDDDDIQLPDIVTDGHN